MNLSDSTSDESLHFFVKLLNIIFSECTVDM